MKMKKSIALLLSLGLVAFSFAGCGNKDDEGKQPEGNDKQTASSYVWGSASLGSNGYVIIEAFVSTINKNKEPVGFQNSSVATGGGAENMQLLADNEIQFGQGMSSDMANAKNGLEPYGKVIEFNQVLGYQNSDLPIVVFEDSAYQKPEDLKGAKIAVGPANGGAAFVAKILFEELGMSDDVTFVYGSWQECADALKVGQADAAVNYHINGKYVTSVFQELYETKPMRAIGVDPAVIESLVSKHEGLFVSKILDGAYPAYKGEQPCVGTTAVLCCRADVPEDVVYTVTKIILENVDIVTEMAPTQLDGFSKEMAIKTLVPGYPIHPGAAKYYKEAGLWTDDMVMAE